MSAFHDSPLLLASSEFFQKTLDCLSSHIAILNEEGVILAVNATWNAFAASNGLANEFCGPGANYLRSCDEAQGDCSEEAKVVAEGIREVISNARQYFSLEYPCHSPVEQRWFQVRITRFEIRGSVRIVVTHDNITPRKLAELGVLEANRRLAQMAATDGLTGIANRRSFDATLQLEWKRHARSRQPLALAMLDIDCFKQFNDKYGHLAGDDCLQAVARTLAATVCRPGDVVARYGGEEFAIILPNTASAAPALERVLHNIRGLAIPHGDSKVARGIVTVSIGFAAAVPSERESPEDLLRQADQALYAAKENGRDQLVSAPATPHSSPAAPS